jgi:hypothetical protein
MKIGILGYPKSGKTSLFNILTALDVQVDKFSTDKRHHVGMARLDDARLDRIASLMQSKKTTYASIEFVDLAGSRDAEEMRAAVEVQEFRNVNALLHVARAFEDPENPHPAGGVDALRDMRNFEADLVLGDLMTVEKRLEKLEQIVKKSKEPEREMELAALRRCHAQLNREKPLRELPLDAAEERALRGFAFMSQKPLLHVVNLSEDAMPEAESRADALRQGLFSGGGGGGRALAAASCRLELELSRMESSEAEPFLETYGIAMPCRRRALDAMFSLLGLLVFYTAGDNESRAWLLRMGLSAVEAAGTIHSDFAKGFIKAETLACEDLFRLGSFAEARAKGLLRNEGRDYTVADGDIMLFRFNV